jgi:hypothetical protein
MNAGWRKAHSEDETASSKTKKGRDFIYKRLPTGIRRGTQFAQDSIRPY